MTKLIEFYFDFISPYSYIAHKRLKIINEDKKFNILYKPILLGGLHNLSRITAPAFNERKLKNMKNDCLLIANKNNIEFYWNSKFPINSLYLMRGYLAIDDKYKKNYFEACFDAYWKNNIDILDEKEVEEILKVCEINRGEYSDKIQDQKIKTELKNLTDQAFEKDIFGAPTFVVNNKIFWGQDRLDYALEEYNT
ncbi:2-hydroxychromene-2-carboxylate isomerase [Pelagibacterales bacterium SAG-MED13]|nr:2-hydroxychromene-2-carboxylate isomerase [Pelagibacterales bacterium SAG-MED13]